MLYRILSLLLLIQTVLILSVNAQEKRVLFLGNSYTNVNNLPQLVVNLAASAGDNLYIESNSPGSYTLGYAPLQHLSNTISLNKIRAGFWDYVVLQDQSQLPSIPALRDSCMLPASAKLFDSVKLYNPCAEVLFYLTWGRRFGGTQCFSPDYCSVNFANFGQMQDSLTRSYMLAADLDNQPLAPVGEAWRMVLENTPMVLHSGDNSHPSINGSYLAACVFYSAIFHKRSFGLTYTAGLQPDSAAILQQAADHIVFTYSEMFNLWQNEVQSDFSYQLNQAVLNTTNLSENSTDYLWDFGDGTFSNDFEPSHTYTKSGTYNLKLRSCNGCDCDSTATLVSVYIISSPVNIVEQPTRIHLTVPDNAGNVSFNGFNGSGTLRIYNYTGNNIVSLQVTQGKATIPALPASVYVWELVSDNDLIATGKTVLPVLGGVKL